MLKKAFTMLRNALHNNEIIYARSDAYTIKQYEQL
jgi:hypothetical protein